MGGGGEQRGRGGAEGEGCAIWYVFNTAKIGNVIKNINGVDTALLICKNHNIIPLLCVYMCMGVYFKELNSNIRITLFIIKKQHVAQNKSLIWLAFFLTPLLLIHAPSIHQFYVKSFPFHFLTFTLVGRNELMVIKGYSEK